MKDELLNQGGRRA